MGFPVQHPLPNPPKVTKKAIPGKTYVIFLKKFITYQSFYKTLCIVCHSCNNICPYHGLIDEEIQCVVLTGSAQGAVNYKYFPFSI